jgi:hypothetical protein
MYTYFRKRLKLKMHPSFQTVGDQIKSYLPEKRINMVAVCVENLCYIGTATKRSITQRLRHKTYLLRNVAAHNVAVTKRKSYKM